MLIVNHGVKGVSMKSNRIEVYSVMVSVSKFARGIHFLQQTKNTWQRVHFRGEAKRKRSLSESDKPAALRSQGRRLKGREVTGMRPETSRSIPGQDEAGGNSRGGPLPVLALTVRVTWG